MTAQLVSIEQKARELDGMRATRLSKAATGDDIDAYMRTRDEEVARIKPAEDFYEEIVAEFYGSEETKGLRLPWQKMHGRWNIRRGEVTCWCGYNGAMKSTATGYVLLELIRQREKGCVLSFEMKPKKTLRRMASQVVGTPMPTPEYIQKFLNSVTGRLYLYDEQDTVSPERVFAVITYCAEKLGVTQFIVDSLMKVVKGDDDYSGQKNFVDRLCTLARDLNVHIHLVTHARKGADETKRPGKQDNKGSGSIVDLVDNFAVVFKIPKKEDDTGPDFCLYLDKQRHGEFEGHIALWLDPSLQFMESPHDRPFCYV